MTLYTNFLSSMEVTELQITLAYNFSEDIIDIKISFDSKFMLSLSSSKNGKMKLYDLQDREVIHVFHDVNKGISN